MRNQYFKEENENEWETNRIRFLFALSLKSFGNHWHSILGGCLPPNGLNKKKNLASMLLSFCGSFWENKFC